MFGINSTLVASGRYDQAQFSNYDTDVYDHLDSYFEYKLSSLPISGEFTVSAAEDNRPDLVSYKIYNDVALWWIIMAVNGLINPSEVVAGKKLSYPSLTDIELLLFKLPRFSQ